MTRFQRYRTPFVAATLLSVFACDRDGTPTVGDPGGEPEPGGTAILAVAADINVPNPLVAQTELDGSLAPDILYMELLRSSWEDGRLIHQTADQNPMALSRSYEFLPPDSSAIRFNLRSDVRWSDGERITAEDVAFTYDLLREPELASPRAGDVEQLDSVQVVNDSTVVFHFAARYPEMLFHTGIAIIPEHVFGGRAPAEFRSHPALRDPGRNLVVSGPFTIGEWRKGQEITLVRNPYFRPQPHLERIVFRVIPDPTTRLTELRTGAVDFVKGVPHDQIPSLRAQAPHVRFERERQRNYEYIAYSPEGFPGFADVRVRRALRLAIDVPTIIEALQLEEYAEPAGGPYAPIFSELNDPERTPPLPYEPDEARRLLEAAGWVDTDGDGIREKDGTPLRFTLVTNSGNQRRADVSQIVQQQWRQVGVDAQLRTHEFNTFMGNLVGREYEAALGGWIVALSPDISPLFASNGAFNVTGIGSPAADSLMAAAIRQRTPDAASDYWRRASAEVVSMHPYTWLYYYDTVDGVNERLRGMRIDTYGSYQNAWEWWIPQERQRARVPGDTTGRDTAAGAGAGAPADTAG